MKKACLIMVMIFGIIGFTQAQGRLQEVVYLKNGSIIRGTIIEQVPNRTLKIETADGSVFVYPMREVQKIAKEPYRKRYNNNTRQYNYRDNRAPRYQYNSDFTPRGYRGFVELGYAFGIGDSFSNDRLEISTTHGFQFNPYIFVGGGAGLHIYTDPDDVLMPVFGEFRANMCEGSITPYIGLKLGYSLLLGEDDYASTGGFYFSPSVGARFMVGNSRFVDVALGYSLQQLDYDFYIHNQVYYDETTSMHAIHLKVGFEF